MSGRMDPLPVAVIAANDAVMAPFLQHLAGAAAFTRLVAAVEAHRARPFALVLAGRDAEGRDWREARAQIPDIPVAALLEDGECAEEAFALGVADVIAPPFDATTLAMRLPAIVAWAAERRALLHAVDLAGVLVEVVDGEGRFEHVSAAFEEVTGYTASEALGRTPAELVRSSSENADFLRELWDRVAAGESWSGTYRSRRKDGRAFSHRAGIAPVMVGGDVRRIFAIKRETTTEQASAERLRAFMDTATDGLLVAELGGSRLIEVNAAAARLFGYPQEELANLPWGNLVAPGQESVIEALIETLPKEGAASVDRLRMVRKDGSQLWVDARISVFTAGGVQLTATMVRDVSERVLREEELARSYRDLTEMQFQLVQSQRLAAVGELAASMAHEINNPASYAMLNLAEARRVVHALAVEHGDSVGELPSLVDESLDGVRRIAAVVHDLRTFHRVDRGGSTLVDLNDVVRVACRMAHNELRHRATMIMELAPDATVHGDASKLCQVLLGLLLNAAHAFDEHTGTVRRVTVITFADRDEVTVTVEDTGCGMPDSVRQRVFEPHFTTKHARGAGLGLALCAKLVREHGGTIDLQSTEGRGTRVSVSLPAAAPAPILSSGLPVPAAAAEGRPRILLIDDEPMVLKALARSLRETGPVAVARGGHAALIELARGAQFDVVVCDLMMPEMDGPATYEAIVAARPGLKRRFVFCSGGVFTPRAREFLSTAVSPLVTKPVAKDALERAIAEVLTGPA
jgi:PAS domain S-box-containing protein